MVKRLFDICSSSVALLALSPVMAATALGIKLVSRGPVLYRAQRVGRGGAPFVMYKFRTMHVRRAGSASAITGVEDERVFKFGKILRIMKLDELPELCNVLKGEMSVVGPRPEDASIVERFYTDEQRETLRVLPGLASPGSIFNYTHGDAYLAGADPEQSYATKLLPVKLALEQVYISNASMLYDLRIIARTLQVLGAKLMGRTDFPLPPEWESIDPSLRHGRS